MIKNNIKIHTWDLGVERYHPWYHMNYLGWDFYYLFILVGECLKAL